MGIQEKKGKNIVIADLTESEILYATILLFKKLPSQVGTIVDSVKRVCPNQNKPSAVGVE